MRIRRFLIVGAIVSAVVAATSARQAHAEPVTPAKLEGFLSLPTGSLDAITLQGAIEGSALRLTFAASAGDVLSFDWDFLTDENFNAQSFNDLAFVTLGTQVNVLGDVYSSTFIPSMTPFFDETGYQSFSMTFATTGTFTLGVGILDVGDDLFDSALLLDNFALSGAAVPNGSFENGFASFSVIGDAGIVTADFGVTPTDGSQQALLTTAVPEPGSLTLVAAGALTGLVSRAVRRLRRFGESTSDDKDAPA
ncbi:MAG: hypothetical protein WKF75_13195 [Singulisphaera sp.]